MIDRHSFHTPSSIPVLRTLWGLLMDQWLCLLYRGLSDASLSWRRWQVPAWFGDASLYGMAACYMFSAGLLFGFSTTVSHLNEGCMAAVDQVRAATYTSAYRQEVWAILCVGCA